MFPEVPLCGNRFVLKKLDRHQISKMFALKTTCGRILMLKLKEKSLSLKPREV
jgi:hypothetical protein